MGISERALKRASDAIRRGGAGVLPTDTLYGLVGSALRKKTVARIYRLRQRMRGKPMIVLIAGPEELERFGIKVNSALDKILQAHWPGKVSMVVPCRSEKFTYLHRGTRTIAFRVPRLAWLRDFLRETGPLVAPSANLQGMPPASTVREAKKVFGNAIDFYVDAGRRDGKPSKVIRITRGKMVVLRK